MCMKLSTKGVRPTHICLELGLELGRRVGLGLGLGFGLGLGLGYGVGVRVMGGRSSTLISVESSSEQALAPLSVPRAQKLRMTSAQHAPG